MEIFNNRNIVKREIRGVLQESYTYVGTERKGDQIHLIYRNGDKKENPITFSKKFLDTNHENISKILRLIDEVLDYMNIDKKDVEDEKSGNDGFGF
jgi:hypothetical protein